MGITFGFSGSSGSTNKDTSGVQTTQKVLGQPAIDKLIYDVLSSDNGLAQLVSGENLAGGSNSSTKTLMSQDFLTKIIGELANVTAQTVSTSETTSSENNKSKSGGVKTVICTELLRQGRLSQQLYDAGNAAIPVDPTVYAGYICWAKHVVPLMRHSPRLSAFLAPIAIARYEQILGKTNLLGALAVRIGHPVCYVIGFVGQVFSSLTGEQNARASS